jgi:hypothetical protein
MFSQDIPERTSYPSAYTPQITDGQVDYRKKIKTYLKKSSPQKPSSQMNWNLLGNIYGRSSIKIANFIPIH